MSLVVRDLKKTYPSPKGRLEILKGIELSAQPGQTLSIMGPSGVGKSTLIALLAGLDTPDSGEVILDGQSLYQLNANQLNSFRGRKIGLVFQQFHLIDHMTALENVALPLEFQGDRKALEKASAQLGLLGLADRLDHFPQQLSRGECQRVAIARVLVTKPLLVLADEPTGSLDEKNAAEVFESLLVSTKASNAILALVTHDPQLAQRCQDRYRIQSGRMEKLE